MTLEATIESGSSKGGVPLDYAETPTRPGLLSRLMAARGLWALTDQGVCSLGNFLTNVVIGRFLVQHAYGVYALIFYYVLIFLNTLHGAIVTYPLTLHGASATPRQIRSLVFRALGFTVGLVPFLSIAIVAACWRLERLSMMFWAILAMLLWQCQETIRRSMLARLRHRSAIPGDAISFLGQAVAVYFLGINGLLTPESALACVAMTSGLAAVVQLGQVAWQGRAVVGEPDEPRPPFIAEAIAWGKAGRWIALSCVVSLGTIYLTPWVLEAVRGEAEVAAGTVLNSLLNLTNPVVFGLSGLVVPAVAAARRAGGSPRQGLLDARAVAVRYATVGLLFLIPYYAIVLIAPGFMLKLLYRGAAAQYLPFVDVIPYVVAVYAALFFAYMLVSYLNGIGESRASFLATIASTLVTIVLVVPLAYHYGLRGAMMAGVVPILAQVGVLALLARRVLAQTPDDGPSHRIGTLVPVEDVPRAPSQGFVAASTVAGSSRRRLRVLISSYALSPIRGSEPGVGWGYCTNLARHHDVTVLCAPGTPGSGESVFRDEMEAYFREHGPIPGLTLAYVERPLLSRLFQREDEFSRRTLYYLGYNAWQRSAFRLALKLHADKPFDLAHHLNMTGFREPGYLWKLPIPFVWGPIAGAANIPGPFLRIMTPLDRAYYTLRNWTTTLQKWTALRCRKAARRASHIWTIGHASQNMVERIWGFASETLVESGAARQPSARVRVYDPNRPLKIVWSGVHIGRKALPLLLQAVAKLDAMVNVQVVILGGGTLADTWKELAEKLGIARRVRFAGHMARAEAMAEVSSADLMVFTSVQDGTPQAVLEAMSLGVPVICHDACGMGVVVNDTCGVKVELTDPEMSIAGFASAIQRFTQEPDLLRRLSAGAIERTRELDWSCLAERVARVYDRVANESKVEESAVGRV